MLTPGKVSSKKFRASIFFHKNIFSRNDKYWFAKPCRPFHEIVYAKQKGFPYWPAKVVGKETTEAQLEVRFFGGFHQRALVEKHHIKPITTNIHSLQVNDLKKLL